MLMAGRLGDPESQFAESVFYDINKIIQKDKT
jgi:hypothetical protein